MTTPRPHLRPDSVEQEQFLTVLPREEALRRFAAALDPRPLGAERVGLGDLVGRVLAEDVVAPTDVPPFDRALVDGFALRAADVAAAGEAAPATLALNPEVIACGTAPALMVSAGTATPIATGGPVPRGADAVVMIEHTEPVGEGIAVRRAASPGGFIGFAGSDIAHGEVLLRRGTVIGSREVGMLAACGLDAAPVWRRPRIAVLSTGDELVPPGRPLGPAQIHDANGPIVAAALRENGAEPVPYGAFPDEEAALGRAIRQAFAECDGLVLSGGTSKGAGDLSHRLVADLGEPGIVAHGVALKPGKPLLLAVCGAKPVIVLPGFPTSAMFTFHSMVAPFLRRMAGLPERAEAEARAAVPVRVASEAGRTEFVMVSLVEGAGGLAAYPTGKGSGAVTAFAQADGFITVEALADHVPAGTDMPVTLFSPHLQVPDLVIMGSHCLGLDAILGRLAAEGFTARVMNLGSLGGLAAARRGECDLAPIHLLDPATGRYNTPYMAPGLELIPGWRRVQGLVFRPGDPRFEGRDPREAIAAAASDPACLMVNRNGGSGTRILVDRLLASTNPGGPKLSAPKPGAPKPDGYWNQPRSHNAVAAAVAQGRADWGIAVAPAAAAYHLAFSPIEDEHYDFACVAARRDRPAVAAFLRALGSPEVRGALARLGYRPADEEVTG